MNNTHNEFRAADAIEFTRALDACGGNKEIARRRMSQLNERIKMIEKGGEPVPTYLLAAYRAYESVLAPGTIMVVKLDDTLPAQYVEPPDGAAPEPWIPISDALDLKHLGKLAEELGEAVAVVGRCIVQGMTGIDPKTGETNREQLQKEAADVLANLDLNVDRFSLDRDAMARRVERKKEFQRRWHAQVPRQIQPDLP